MKVGRRVKVLTDLSRNEIVRDSKEKRKLIISIFYPVENNWNTDRQAFYIDLYHPQEQWFIDEWKASGIDECYIRNIKTNIYMNAPMKNSSTKYPILIYSPGFSCDRDSSVFTIQKLVEEGYIVITVGHIYETEFTVMPSGEIIEMLNDFKNISSNSLNTWKELISIRKKDIIFLINQLDFINKQDEFLNNKLDLTKVGVIGFSLGSQACFEAAAEDSRIKAVVLFEGCLQNSTVSEKVEAGEKSYTPHLLIKRHASSHKIRVDECYSWYKDMEDSVLAEKRVKEAIEQACIITKTQKDLYEYIKGYKSFVKINHSKHMTFSDIPILQNKEYEECLGGQLLINKAYKIISEVALRFFNEFLYRNTNEYQNFINNENSYPELKKINSDGEII
jgi:predicted dienelactone hydrolase